MTRRTERICYLVLFVLLVGFVVFDWYDRRRHPGMLSGHPTDRWEFDDDPPLALNPWRIEVSDPAQSPPLLEESAPPFEWESEPRPADANPAWSGPSAAPHEIEAFYNQLIRRKSAPPPRPIVYHDWELAGGRKPDWWVAQEWRNRLRYENYKNPGPVYSSSHVDPFGNRHYSFEDRSGRLDVFQTWGRERVYLTPK